MADDENAESPYDRIKRLVAIQLSEDPDRFKVYLPLAETDDDRFVLERIYWMENISSRLVAYVSPEQLRELFPTWLEPHGSDVSGELEERPGTHSAFDRLFPPDAAAPAMEEPAKPEPEAYRGPEIEP
jgi:hypothetical protein